MAVVRARIPDTLLRRTERGALVALVRLDSIGAAERRVELTLATAPSRSRILNASSTSSRWAVDTVPPGRYVFGYTVQTREGFFPLLVTVRAGYRDTITIAVPTGTDCLLPSPHSA